MVTSVASPPGRIAWLERVSPWWLLAITCLLGWQFKAHCGGSWSGSIQYTTGCYSDAVPFWGLRGVSAGQVPYLQARMEYPVLTGALIWIEGAATRLFGGEAWGFLATVSAVNAGFAFLVLRLMERAGVDRRRLLAWAAAPVLVLYLGHNWDMLAVAFAIGAALLAHRGRLEAATALAALGAAAKLFPVVLLPLLGLAALTMPGQQSMARLTAAVRLVAIAVIAWALVNLPVALLAPANWREFYTFSQERSGTAASVWEILSVHGWWPSSIPARNIASFATFAGGAAAIVTLGWRRHKRRPWLLFGPVLAWFLLTNKVYSPQFDLWLYPVLLLTSYRLWPVAWFAAGDILAYFAEFWWFAGLDGAHPAATTTHIAVAAAVRGAALLWVIGAALTRPAPEWITRSQFAPTSADAV